MMQDGNDRTRQLPTYSSPPPAMRSPGGPPAQGPDLPPNLIYPWEQRGQPSPPPRQRRPWFRLALLLVLLILAIFAGRVVVFLAAISTEPVWATHFWPLGGAREANVLVLGYGGAGHDGAYLTDSLLLLHSDLPRGHSAQISVPRDLWVQIPPNSGHYAKINSAYAYGRAEHGDDPVAGGALATTKVAQVTGLAGDRWITIDFRGFRALVDALGGVDIDVERTFASQYPANDNPAIDPNWITVTFQAGRQHMDGETAIRYARARYADLPEEANDFARAQRQQRLVAAIAARMKQPTNWWRAWVVMDALQPALRTNLAPADLISLVLRADLTEARRIPLDTSNVLAESVSSDGQAILIPRDNDYDLIVRYIRAQLAGS